MYYPEDVVEQVRQQNNIVDVISAYVRLTRHGSSYTGLCPFHNEKTPSFSVSESKQIFKCFGCGESGNVVTFLMKYENYTFPEALKVLAERVGITLPEQDYSEAQKQKAQRRNQLLEINRQAALYFFSKLKTEHGKNAYRYFAKERGLTNETIVKFGLGYADYSDGKSDDLYRYLKEKGYSDELLKSSGLITIRDGKAPQDKFWNRAMFPILDANQRVIGFGGRVMGDGKPKYMNSPDTEVFDKSRNLFGLYLARRSKRQNMILCEGYMDVIAMHQAGFDNAVASLGTALTEGQAALLKRYTKEILLTYDSDEAGTKAALRAVPILKKAGLGAKVVRLSPYKDPDEFIKAEGAESFEQRLKNAQNSFYFQAEVLERGYDLSDPAQKTEFFHEVARLLCKFEDEIERNVYMEAAAEKYRVDYKQLRELVNKYGLQERKEQEYREAAMRIREERQQMEGWNYRENMPGQAVPNTGNFSGRETLQNQGTKRRQVENGVEKAQKMLLMWFSVDPILIKKLSGFVGLSDFKSEFYHKMAEVMYAQVEKTGKIEPAAVISRFEDEQEQTRAADVFFENTLSELSTQEKEKALNEIVRKIREHSLSYDAEHTSDLKLLQKIYKEKEELKKLKIRLS